MKEKIICPYKINIFQENGEWVAAITELAILMKGNSPSDLLEHILQRQSMVLDQLQGEGIKFPPKLNVMHPISRATKIVKNYFKWSFKIISIYLFILFLTGSMILAYYPVIKTHFIQYASGPKIEADIKKILSKLNIQICQKI